MSCEEDRKKDKQMIGDALHFVSKSQGTASIKTGRAGDLLAAFNRICQSYDDEIENLGYETLGDDL